MAFLEICAVANAGKVLCESCYMVEGDSCLILRAESIFQRIEKTIVNGCFLPTLNSAVDKTLQCMRNVVHLLLRMTLLQQILRVSQKMSQFKKIML